MFYQLCCIEGEVCKNKTESQNRRLKSKSWEHQRTPDSKEHQLIGAHQTPPYLHWNQPPPKGQQVPEQDIPWKFSSNTGTEPWASIYSLPKVTSNPLTSQNSLLDTSLHSREKKSSSIHQNSDTSFPAGVQPRWIQGIRRVDGVGVERLVCLLM